ncbi:hypothetical protein Bbelb_377650 [Branchiostoma belcheri]|nr:hypothetical protein Bbelb_377650 [Branchiostoma belcheri]
MGAFYLHGFNKLQLTYQASFLAPFCAFPDKLPLFDFPAETLNPPGDDFTPADAGRKLSELPSGVFRSGSMAERGTVKRDYHTMKLVGRFQPRPRHATLCQPRKGRLAVAMQPLPGFGRWLERVAK